MTATPPSGTGSGCWRSIAAISCEQDGQAHPRTRCTSPASGRGCAAPPEQQLARQSLEAGLMPFLLIDFPAFKPIALEIGPFAIRWYALAYISGIVFGWLYARSLLKKERLWGGPAPISLVQVDDFILWVTLGIILGGRTGYVLFYNLPFFIEHPAALFRLSE